MNLASKGKGGGYPLSKEEGLEGLKVVEVGRPCNDNEELVETNKETKGRCLVS
jgi:hypothetical protein